MSRVVLDSSVILAILKSERIDAAAYSLVDGGLMSAVNVAEVYGKMKSVSTDISSALTDTDRLFAELIETQPFTEKQARLAGLLYEPTRQFNLALGDRACLALALDIDAVVYTVDSVWEKLDVGCEIRLLR
jgi:ribonuclease VapC